MKPIEKAIYSLGTWGILSFLITDPFKMGDDNGNPTSNTPIVWMIYGTLTYLLIRIAIANYKQWIDSQPKKTFVPNSRPHHSKITTKKEVH